MCIPLESTPLSFTLSSATALSSLCCISLSSLHLTLLLPICVFSLSLNLSLFLIFYLSANPQYYCHTYKCVHAGCASTHGRTHICTQAHNHAHAYINVQTHAHRQYQDTSAHTHTHADTDSSRMVLSCTATHCVYAEPLSLLVERCYALLTSGEENIQSCPPVINWWHNYPPLHLPPGLSQSVCVWGGGGVRVRALCVWYRGDYSIWNYNDHRNSSRIKEFKLLKNWVTSYWWRRIKNGNWGFQMQMRSHWLLWGLKKTGLKTCPDSYSDLSIPYQHYQTFF